MIWNLSVYLINGRKKLDKKGRNCRKSGFVLSICGKHAFTSHAQSVSLRDWWHKPAAGREKDPLLIFRPLWKILRVISMRLLTELDYWFSKWQMDGKTASAHASSRAPASSDSASALSMQGGYWPVNYCINHVFSGVQWLISRFKWKVALIRYARQPSERVCGSVWPERPLPSLAAGSATPAQAQLKHHHPVKHEVDPKSTAKQRLAPMRSGILQDALEVDMYF